MSNINDFVIKDGVLTRYRGKGGDVVIPDGVNVIEKTVFHECTGLTGVVIPEGVINIGAGAFLNCKNLVSVVIPESTNQIGEGAFVRCVNLKHLVLPVSLGKNIAEYITDSDILRIHISDLSVLPAKYRRNAALCFAEDGGLPEDPRFESHSKYIKANAGKMVKIATESHPLLALLCREEWIKAKDVEMFLTAARETADAEAIAMLLDYQQNKLTEKQKEKAIKQKGKQEDTIFNRAVARLNKEGISGLNFVMTGDLNTFASRKTLKAFIEEKGGKLQTSMSAKTDYLIMNNESLNTVKEQQAKELGIEFITERQFNEKVGRRFEIDENGVLTRYLGVGGDVVIPDGVTEIGQWAFHNCIDMTGVIIPESVTQIHRNAFSWCKKLAGIVLPDGVTNLDDEAFIGCSSLKSLVIPDGITMICNRVFCYCSSLSDVVIPDGVTMIGEDAFYDCSSLASITIPNSVTRIGRRAFYNCSSLTDVVIPDSVPVIGEDTFCNCRNLTNITIPGSVTSIGITFFGNNSNVFDGCRNLKVHGKAGSYAETYAKENNIPFVAE